VRHGIVLPGGLDLPAMVAAGREAEAAGWDGVFYWDGVVPGERGYDPLVVLAAIAGATERIRLGAVLVPLPWRKPWLVARAAATLDQLSGGRAILPVGLGAVHPPEIEAGATIVGEPVDRRERAELLDEGLEVVSGLSTGQPFSYQGRRYRLSDVALPPPLQRPGVPIWVVGAWGSRASMARAFRYDGWMPARVSEAELPAVRDYLEAHRPTGRPFDVAWEGSTPGDDPAAAAEIVRPYAQAGVTWWLESMWQAPNGPEDVRRRIRAGPPGGRGDPARESGYDR
jgi:alkanesulfonate monooxygenase SsuD/methylene tetrahydromethanopterin reductase-like flavin-dependent oxidoreductase (luciferase family)